MSLYACSKCRAVENTALGGYWRQQIEKREPLCSECEPTIGKWHGKFPKESADNGKWEPDPRMPPYLRHVNT